MNRTERKKNRTDRAWNKLYLRLEQERLIPSREDEKLRALPLWKWGLAVAAVLALCIYSGISYFTEDPSPDQTFLVQQNKELSTLVTTLEDGSIVYLGGETSLHYPEHFLPERREVMLQGQALFDVAGNKDRPFLIETNETQIEVLGTAFNVKSDGAAPFELSVQRGKVKVTLKKTNQEVYVKAGETVILTSGKFHLDISKDNGQFARYLENMRFKDELLANILRVVNLHFSEKQLILSPELAERRLTVAFLNDSPEAVAELICLAMNLKCTREGNILKLSEE